MRLPLITLLLTPLTAAVLVVETSTSTYTAAPTTTGTSDSSPPRSSSTPSSSSSPQYTSSTIFESAILNSTNTYRTHYNATALTWNASLATYASAYASNCIFNHSRADERPGGENIAEGYANATAAVEAWGNEGRHFDFHDANNNDGGGKESTGHFSQLVWKSTTSVGCGRSACEGRNGVPGWLVVCEYWPAGNVEGEFGEEVGRVVSGAWEVVSGDERVGEELVGLAEKMNGAAAGRGDGVGVLMLVVGVGVGIVVAWGV